MWAMFVSVPFAWKQRLDLKQRKSVRCMRCMYAMLLWMMRGLGLAPGLYGRLAMVPNWIPMYFHGGWHCSCMLFGLVVSVIGG